MSFRVDGDNAMERYVAFICSELRDEYDIILNEPNGKEYFIKHLGGMRFTENDEELKRLL